MRTFEKELAGEDVRSRTELGRGIGENLKSVKEGEKLTSCPQKKEEDRYHSASFLVNEAPLKDLGERRRIS